MKPEALVQAQLALAALGPSEARVLPGYTGLTQAECAAALAELGRLGWARECLGVWAPISKKPPPGRREVAAGEQAGRATPARGGSAEPIGS